MGDYKKLAVWKRSHDLTLSLDRYSASFPDMERYGLTSQIRRAAVSIVSNIAEGASRHNDRELVRFLQIAHGSACEVECQLLLSRDLGYLKPDSWAALNTDCMEIGGMLNGLIRSARNQSSSSRVSSRATTRPLKTGD